LNFREDSLITRDSVKPEKDFPVAEKYPEEKPPPPRIPVRPQKVIAKRQSMLEKAGYARPKRTFRIPGPTPATGQTITFERPKLPGPITGVYLEKKKEAAAKAHAELIRPAMEDKAARINRRLKSITATGQETTKPLEKRIIPVGKPTGVELKDVMNEKKISSILMTKFTTGEDKKEERLNWLDRFFLWINRALGSV